MKRLLATLVIMSVVLGPFALNQPVYADHNASHSAQECADSGGYWDDNRCNAEGCGGSFLGLPTWHKYLRKTIDTSGRCSVELPEITTTVTKGGETSTETSTNWPRAVGYISIAIVEALLRIASLVAVGYVIYGGFRYITSQGDPEGAKSARQTIINALVGLVIAIAAASIVAFIGNRLGDS